MTMTDAELATQPAAYWAGVAYESLVAYTRARQADHGYTQPQFWLLRHLSVSDLSPDGRGLTLCELYRAMRGYLRREDDLGAEAEALMDRGWLVVDEDGRLWCTEAGEAALVELKEWAPAIRAEIHAGIGDADYVAALKVIHQLIRNAGGVV